MTAQSQYRLLWLAEVLKVSDIQPICPCLFLEAQSVEKVLFLDYSSVVASDSLHLDSEAALGFDLNFLGATQSAKTYSTSPPNTETGFARHHFYHCQNIQASWTVGIVVLPKITFPRAEMRFCNLG